jgi:hypothetical protein
LRNDRRYIADGPGPIDPRDPDSPTVEQFRWLDRPQVESLTGLGLDDVPRVLARVLVGSEIVALETFDDGGMADRQARFMEEFAGMVPPAHPRSKTLGRVPRAAHAMEIEWALPDEAAPSDIERLSALERTRLMTQVWPKTALPALRGRTPRQAAKAGDATLPLQAALRILERSGDAWRDQIDLAPLRAELGLAPEQPIAIEHAHIATIHLARLCQLPIETLDDEGLIAVFRRAQRYMVLDVVERSARAILERPALLDSGKLDRVTVFSSLAHLARSRGDNDQAMIWIKQGRETEPAADRTKNAVRWDVIELRLRASTEAPEAWVPTLAALLERVRDDKTAGSYVLTTLLDLGLVQPVQNPDRPEEILLDSRVLQAMLARYGPRITTAEGELAVSASAAKGEVWTPEKDAAGRSGTIWTPGTDSASGSSEAKPGLIIPGR